jgi:hypothetical protein
MVAVIHSQGNVSQQCHIYVTIAYDFWTAERKRLENNINCQLEDLSTVFFLFFY